MPFRDLQQDHIQPQVKWPPWIGYAITVLMYFLLTVGLHYLYPIFPLANYPIPYILLIMTVAYLFGEGPAILAFFLGLVTFAHWAIPSINAIGTNIRSIDVVARLTAYILGTIVVGFATILIRRSTRRIRSLAGELERQRALTDSFIQNVPVGLLFIDRDMNAVIVNPVMETIGEFQTERENGKTLKDILPECVAEDLEDMVNKVFDSGQTVISNGYNNPMKPENYFDVDCIPVMTSDGEIIGAGIVVVNTTEQVLLYKTLEESYERERNISDILQTGLVGKIPEQLGVFEFDSVYRAALEEARIGGDFYDVFSIDNNKIGIVIGDVSGKGLNAAVQVAMTKYSIRSRAYDLMGPGDVLKRVNEVLVRDMDSENFVTIFVGVLDTEKRTLTYANGGHAPAMFWDSLKNNAVLLQPTGPLVGAVTGPEFSEQTITLNPDDEIFLSTDGLLELQCAFGYLQIDDLLGLYANAKRAGFETALDFVDHVVTHCKTAFRDDLAILRISLIS